jgi:hypothetical protein
MSIYELNRNVTALVERTGFSPLLASSAVFRMHMAQSAIIDTCVDWLFETFVEMLMPEEIEL